jgi:hypothetical protein
MRSLQRNQRGLHYAVPIGTEPIRDEYGNDTLEVRTTFSSPAPLRVNVSANVGEHLVDAFGSKTEYSRTITIAGTECPLSEGCRVWFGVQVTQSSNYRVAKVAVSKNGFLVALQEVTIRG